MGVPGYAPASARMRVQVYRNIRRGDWSIRCGGRVIDHHFCVFLRDASFHVSPAGRARVIESGHKNVHAWVEGENLPFPHHMGMPDYAPECRIIYNPRTLTQFVRADTLAPISRAGFVHLDSKGGVWGWNVG